MLTIAHNKQIYKYYKNIFNNFIYYIYVNVGITHLILTTLLVHKINIMQRQFNNLLSLLFMLCSCNL